MYLQEKHQRNYANCLENVCFELETTHGYEYEGYMYGVEHVIAEWPIKGIRESVLNT